MAHTTLSGPRTEEALATLNHLIANVATVQNDSSWRLREHLQSARVYLLGAMPDEYEFSLAAAKEAAADLADLTQRNLVRRDVAALLHDVEEAFAPGQIRHRHRQPPHAKTINEAGKSELYCFFHGSGTILGVFYPTHYIFAVFPSFGAATNAAGKLQEVGFEKDELAAVTSAEALRFFNEVRADVGLWGELMSRISRFFGTEEVFADIDIRRSGEGAGFLAVYCPHEQEAELVHYLLEPFEPLSMQLYLPGGIRSLCAGKSPGPQGNHPQQN
jgi:hypothetical protein